MRRLIILAASLVLTAALAFAQDAPVLINVAEYDIGLDCPLAQELSPDGSVLTVLMSGCFSRKYSIQEYNVADGSPREIGVDHSADLEALRAGYVDGRTNPLFLDPGGILAITYIENETYIPRNLFIRMESTGALGSDPAGDVLADVLLEYTDYPESALYNFNHTLAAVTGSTALNVVDLETGSSVFSLPVAEETYNAFPSFSTDNQTLYVAALDNFEDMESYASTVSAYSLADGTLTGSFAAPSFLIWVSPDGKYAAAEIGSNDGETSELMVVDTASGAVSEPFSLYEPPRPLTACVNDGRNMSDVDFTVSGRLFLTSVDWLPDSSEFVFTRSYNGEAAGGGSPCAFNYSRLNRINVGRAE